MPFDAAKESTSRRLLFLKPRSEAMMRRAFCAILFGGIVIAASELYAQQSGTSLADAARQASGNFQPVAAQNVGRAKADLAAAMSQLDAFLRTGAPSKAIGWKRYLQWNDLLAIVQS